MSESRKVWIVTDGYYSDRKVCGVFETEELANAVVQAPGDGDDTEEMVLYDSMPEMRVLYSGYVRADGEITVNASQVWPWSWDWKERTDVVELRGPFSGGRIYHNRLPVVYECKGYDEQRVRKVLSDRFAAWKAMGDLRVDVQPQFEDIPVGDA